MKVWAAHIRILFILLWLLTSAVGTASGSPGDIPPALGEALSTLWTPSSPTYTGCGGVQVNSIQSDYEQRVIDLVNDIRTDRGLPPLKRVEALMDASRYHAADMVQDNYFNHDTYDRKSGNLEFKCNTWDRITSYYSGWQFLAENIAVGYSTPESVVQGWMDSKGHRENILREDAWEIGVGYYKNNQGSPYWVQDFGRRFNIYPLVINKDVAQTSQRNVSIYIYGSWSEMRLRNDAGEWTAWQKFQNSFNWTLNGGGGLRTVSVELRNSSKSTIVTTSDTIFLDAPQLGNLPSNVQFAYSIPDGIMIPSKSILQPLNLENDEILTWQLTKQGDWFSILPAQGQTPDSFTISPDHFDKNKSGSLSGTLTVTVTDPAGTVGSPHNIQLTLTVSDDPFQFVYLPLARR